MLSLISGEAHISEPYGLMVVVLDKRSNFGALLAAGGSTVNGTVSGFYLL